MEQLCIQTEQSGAIPVLYATGTCRKSGAKFAARCFDHDEMFGALFEAYLLAARKTHALIADVGARFYHLSRKKDLYAGDSVYPNVLGSRIAAEALAAAILAREKRLKD